MKRGAAENKEMRQDCQANGTRTWKVLGVSKLGNQSPYYLTISTHRDSDCD